MPRGPKDPARALTPVEQRIAMMRLAGMTNIAISQYLGCTDTTISQCLRNPHVQQYLMHMEATFVDDLRPVAQRVNSFIEEHSQEAAETVVGTMRRMRSREEDLRAQRLALISAQDILDRSGHKPAMQVESKNLHAHAIAITEEKAEAILATLKEMEEVDAGVGATEE